MTGRFYRIIQPESLLFREEDGEAHVEGLVVPYETWSEVDSVVEGHFIERFAAGSLKKTFAEGMRRAKGYFEHGRDRVFGGAPIMDVQETWETQRGPMFRATLLRGLPEWMIDGLRRGLYGVSLGAEPVKVERVSRPKRSSHNPGGLEERTYRELRAYDISLTPAPHYEEAAVVLRSITDILARQDLVEQMVKEPEKVLQLLRQEVQEAEPTHSEPDTPEAVPEPPADPEAQPGEVEPVEKPTEPAQPDPDDVEASRVTQPPDYLREDEEEDWQL